MDIKTKQEFRLKVLYTHYDLAAGKLLTPVLRPEVAKALSLEHYNDSELIDAIQYWNEHGLLKVATNVEDQLTAAGVDFVERERA